ncbi:hypothetical protein Dda_6239 [Drechslerella dactyloides]|uniref:Uncharacterized protein n=1 Tax=Drechslerella dactyloides TaxID=74499 RepID=A0AAD6IWQ6_DREDA|nr:hypothetical protein Dda_6239 [Drechslerella dactyloides]
MEQAYDIWHSHQMDNQRYIPRGFQNRAVNDQSHEQPNVQPGRAIEFDAPPKLQLPVPAELNKPLFPEGFQRFEELSDSSNEETVESKKDSVPPATDTKGGTVEKPAEKYANDSSNVAHSNTQADDVLTALAEQYLAVVPQPFVPRPAPETFRDDTMFRPAVQTNGTALTIDRGVARLLEQAPGSSNSPADRFIREPRAIPKEMLGLPRPPRKLTFNHKPEIGVELPDKESLYLDRFPLKFTFPICELWLEGLTNANIRFPRGSITHPLTPNPSDESAKSKDLFGKTIRLTVLADQNGARQAITLLAHAQWCLNEFEKAQNIYCPDLRRMSASVRGSFTQSVPVFEGPANKEGFIPSHVHAFWTHERVKYNRAKFLRSFFDECPSWHGRLNLAVMFALMCSYTEGTAVVKSMDDIMEMSEKAKKDGFSDGAFGRMNVVCDDIFRYFYMRFRRVHREGPLYKYKNTMKGVDQFLNLIGSVFERDDFVDVLARKTPIEFRKLSEEELLALREQEKQGVNPESLSIAIEESEKENSNIFSDSQGNFRKAIQKTRNFLQKLHKNDTDEPSHAAPAALNPDEPADPNHVVCCIIFPRGQQDITEELDKAHPWEDQLFWFLTEWYCPGIHAHVSPITFLPANALSTAYAVAVGFRQMKVWLEEPAPAPLPVPDLSEIFKPVSRNASPALSRKSSVTSGATVAPPESATYTVRAQHMEAHLADGLHAVPVPDGEPYPHPITFVAREDIPLPDPLLLRLHRAVSMAATCSGAWAAGDEVMEAEKPARCRWCKVDFPHYCLPSAMQLSSKKLSSKK